MGLKSDPSEGPVRTFIKGSLTGFIEAIICYPTEFVKTQLQLQSKTNPEYTGILDCAKKTVQKNGPMGLYRGALPLIIGSSGKQAARWTGYTTVSNNFKDEKGNISIPARMFSGACGGVSEAIFAVTPIETLKTRVTDDMRRGTGKYTGSFDALVKIVKSDGPMGLYMGVVPTILKQATNQAVRFPVQFYCMNAMTGGDKSLEKNPLYNGSAGAVAGAVSVLVTMPQDTVKTRMQGEEAKALYSSTLDCAKKILKNDGIGFFYAGTWPRMIRVSLDVAITFAVFPLLSKYI
jgi:solute carrier family 25 citrate transporter 1|eukprot:TRINITY_DN1604_c0_g1_i3.p1 TRINITY_DN1604_c0_g1~~TRINITY_DN1604_c0_g1_i3.p1  ORF type:complete len:291 (-),score=49.35 TRINITY_DN1604_c0_g1_i3:110-982(-)